MEASLKKQNVSRRQFITKCLVGGSSLCFGCSYLLSIAGAQEPHTDRPFRAGIVENSGMSYEQIYNFAFRDILAPQMISLARQVGREKLVEMLKKATDELWSRPGTQERFFVNVSKDFMDHVVSMNFLEKSTERRVLKITGCLWAKSFREAGAADLRYAMWCYTDYGMARLAKEKLERNKTLMQGDDCCLLEWTKEI